MGYYAEIVKVKSIEPPEDSDEWAARLLYERKGDDKIIASRPVSRDVMLQVYGIDTGEDFIKDGQFDIIDADRLIEILYPLIDWDIRITHKNGSIRYIACYNNTGQTLLDLSNTFPRY